MKKIVDAAIEAGLTPKQMVAVCERAVDMLEKKQAQHTPGPWTVMKQNHRMRVALYLGKPGEHGFVYRPVTADWHERKSGAKRGTTPSYYGWHEVEEANAALIAAAPALLAALRACSAQLLNKTSDFEVERVLEQASAAIAAATNGEGSV